MASTINIKQNMKSYEPVEITEDFASLLEEAGAKENREGTIVEGIIVQVDKKQGYAMVDVGLKSEGIIPLSEFRLEDSSAEVQVMPGQTTTVFIENFEGRTGVTRLSKERAVKDKTWHKLKESYLSKANVEGVIFGKVRGGFAVNISGIIAFLPGSQIDIRPISNLAVIMEGTQPFRILKMDDKQGNIVVSRKAIMEESLKEEKDEMLKKISTGMIVKCTVKNVAEYGVFLSIHDLDDPEKKSPLDGLLHKTDISWEGVDHPSTLFSMGQVLDLKIIQYNPENQRISLGLKQMQQNPWEAIQQEYVVGQKYKGKISAIVDYGVFVTLAPDIDGLVYHTEIHWTAKNVHPRKLVQQDQEVEVIVLDLDIEKHRISLSIKRCTPNPWEDLNTVCPAGTVMKALVKNVYDFGLFVVRQEDAEQEYPVNILIPSAELSWEVRGEEALKSYNKDDLIDCVIMSIDVPYERVIASIRRLQEDTTASTTEKLTQEESLLGTVKSIKKDGVEIALDQLQVYIDKNDLSKNQPLQDLNLGDQIEFKVLSFDKDRKEYKGSVKALELARKAQIVDQFADNKAGSGTSFSALSEDKN
jgi:small subunit ribosomal protein S1